MSKTRETKISKELSLENVFRRRKSVGQHDMQRIPNVKIRTGLSESASPEIPPKKPRGIDLQGLESFSRSGSGEVKKRSGTIEGLEALSRSGSGEVPAKKPRPSFELKISKEKGEDIFPMKSENLDVRKRERRPSIDRNRTPETTVGLSESPPVRRLSQGSREENSPPNPKSEIILEKFRKRRSGERIQRDRSMDEAGSSCESSPSKVKVSERGRSVAIATQKSGSSGSTSPFVDRSPAASPRVLGDEFPKFNDDRLRVDPTDARVFSPRTLEALPSISEERKLIRKTLPVVSPRNSGHHPPDRFVAPRSIVTLESKLTETSKSTEDTNRSESDASRSPSPPRARTKSAGQKAVVELPKLNTKVAVQRSRAERDHSAPLTPVASHSRNGPKLNFFTLFNSF